MVNLFELKDFAEDLDMRSSWVWVSPKSSGGCPCKTEKEVTERRSQREVGGGGWSEEASISQGRPQPPGAQRGAG